MSVNTYNTKSPRHIFTNTHFTVGFLRIHMQWIFMFRRTCMY